jgi:hypothetical protein
MTRTWSGAFLLEQDGALVVLIKNVAWDFDSLAVPKILCPHHLWHDAVTNSASVQLVVLRFYFRDMLNALPIPIVSPVWLLISFVV